MGVRIATNHDGLQLTSFRILELFDWREAVYIDLDTDGQGAIGSVIQQRPVEIVATADGSISYSYDPVRSTITQVEDNIRDHTWAEVYPKDAASDAIVYYAEVRTLQDGEYAKRFGLSTKVFRMPDLWTGAVKAAKIAMRKILEQHKMHSIVIRPDMRIEVGDILSVNYIASGTNTPWGADIIVENVTTTYSPENTAMKISGREAIP
jgi:hypothetical protein